LSDDHQEDVMKKVVRKVVKAPKLVDGAALAARIDLVKKLRANLDAAKAKLKPLEKRIDEEEAALLEIMVETHTESVRGKLGRATVLRALVPSIEDVKKFEAYVIKHRAFDLYQRRLNTTAWRDRVDAGDPVPGIKGFQRVSLRVS
jgi:hypothetical protein